MTNIIKIIVSLLFLLFAYFQLNDDNPILWTFLYIIPASLYFFKYLHKYKILGNILICGYLLGIIIVVFDNSYNPQMILFSKKLNEIFGLSLSVAWIYYIFKN